MLITPPVLLMLWPAATCSAALLGLGPAPTLMVPVLVVLPPPARVSRNASILTPPLLVRFRIDCAVLTVTTLPPAMIAVSGPPVGTMPHDQSLAVLQFPVAGFQVQLAARACCAGKASRIARRAGLRLEVGWWARMGLSWGHERDDDSTRRHTTRQNDSIGLGKAKIMPVSAQHSHCSPFLRMFNQLAEQAGDFGDASSRSAGRCGTKPVKVFRDANALLVRRRLVVHNASHVDA